MARFAYQHAPSAMEAVSQQPLLRECSGLVEQTIRFNPLRQNSGKLIEKRAALQRAALLTPLQGCTPHHLERARPKGRTAEGLPGETTRRPCRGEPRRALGGEAPWR